MRSRFRRLVIRHCRLLTRLKKWGECCDLALDITECMRPGWFSFGDAYQICILRCVALVSFFFNTLSPVLSPIKRANELEKRDKPRQRMRVSTTLAENNKRNNGTVHRGSVRVVEASRASKPVPPTYLHILLGERR